MRPAYSICRSASKPFSGVYSFADCRMIFIFFLSFRSVVGSCLNTFSDGAGRQRAANNLSIVHHDQRLGGTTGCQIEVCLLFLRRSGKPPRIGRGWHQNSFNPIGCDYVAESDVDKVLGGECHVNCSPFILLRLTLCYIRVPFSRKTCSGFEKV